MANGIAPLGSDGKVPASFLNVSAPPDASLTVKGITMLDGSTNSTSTIKAVTANAVKKANDNANSQYTKPGTGIPKTDFADDVRASLTKADNAATSEDLVSHWAD